MNTDQATVILASLLHSQRAFQSYDLSKEARQRIVAIQHLLEEYEKHVYSSQSSEAQEKVAQAYRLLKAEPPSSRQAGWEHAVFAAPDKADPAAEALAWRAFLAEAADE